MRFRSNRRMPSFGGDRHVDLSCLEQVSTAKRPCPAAPA
jgi:hypothetical protein